MSAQETKRPGLPRSSGRGQKSMIWLAGAALFGLAWLNNSRLAPEKHGDLWPLVVAIIAFMYLWWLGSIFFDLVFIWHRYIQGDGMHKFLRAHVQRKNLSAPEPLEPPPNEAGMGTRPIDPVDVAPVQAAPAAVAAEPKQVVAKEAQVQLREDKIAGAMRNLINAIEDYHPKPEAAGHEPVQSQERSDEDRELRMH